MAADHLQFLKNKFINDFGEAVEEFNNELPLLLHFKSILEVLQRTTIRSSTPIVMKDSLYKLKYLLEECVMFAEKERKYKAHKNKKKNQLNAQCVKKLWFFLKNVNRLVQIRRKLEEMRAAALLTGGDSPSLGWYSVSSFLYMELYDKSEVCGFSDHLKNIEKLLAHQAPEVACIRAIAIVGMGGVGKTALARLFSKTFPWRDSSRIWFHFSDLFTPGGIAFREDIFQKMGRLERDDSRIQVIVLDNVSWKMSNWYFDLVQELSVSGSCLNKRITIIITSRFEEVASKMVGEHNLYRLRPDLDSETCWQIFMGSIQEKNFVDSSDPILVRMKDEISERCEGLPLAAKTLAEIISIQIAYQTPKYSTLDNIEKRITVKLDVHDRESFEQFQRKIKAIPGAELHDYYYDPRGYPSIRMATERNLLEIQRELGKICRNEIQIIS